ncbi:MAG: L,D-transpeptidase family protein [Arenicellales bacterium]
MKDFFLKRPLLLVFLIGLALPSIVRAGEESNYEARLIASADTIASGNWSDALNELNSLTADFPLSRIGHLLKADLLFSLSGQAPARSADPATAELQKQLRLRWSHLQSSEAKRELVPAKLLQISDKVPFVLYADLPASRLHLFAKQHGTLVRLSDYYITIGRAGAGKEREGDLKTPVGVYQIDGYIPRGQLHARYGAGALTTNYPNSLDRFLNRTGYGIWLHGTEPGWINRGPRASEGCLTLSNSDFEQLLIQLGSHQDIPVVIDDAPQWIETQDLHQAKGKVLASITASATRITESSDHRDALASHYGLDEGARITDLVLYPGKQERVFARWINASQSGDVLSVEQYWHPTGDGGWEILLQTSEPAPERLTADLTQTD